MSFTVFTPVTCSRFHFYGLKMKTVEWLRTHVAALVFVELLRFLRRSARSVFSIWRISDVPHEFNPAFAVAVAVLQVELP